MRRSVAVCIVNWNGGDLIRQCIRSVRGGRDLHREVVVVDNASRDGSPDRIALEFPDVRLIRNRENIGFARANNQMLRQLTADYFLLLNPDAVLMPGALERMVEFMDAHPRAGACSPLVVDESGGDQWVPTRFPTVWGELCYCATFLLAPLSWVLCRWRAYGRERVWRSVCGDGRQGIRVDVLNGACLLVRRQALVQIGPLEERFFLFSEEADWCRRMQLAGWGRYWIPSATVVHLVGRSRAHLPEASGAVHFYRSRVLLFAIHRGRLQAEIVHSLYRLSWRWNILVGMVGGMVRPGRRAADERIAHYRTLASELSRSDGDTHRIGRQTRQVR